MLLYLFLQPVKNPVVLKKLKWTIFCCLAIHVKILKEHIHFKMSSNGQFLLSFPNEWFTLPFKEVFTNEIELLQYLGEVSKEHTTYSVYCYSNTVTAKLGPLYKYSLSRTRFHLKILLYFKSTSPYYFASWSNYYLDIAVALYNFEIIHCNFKPRRRKCHIYNLTSMSLKFSIYARTFRTVKLMFGSTPTFSQQSLG